MLKESTPVSPRPQGEDTTTLKVMVNSSEGFARLVAQYQEVAVRVANRVLGQPQDAEDAVQEAILSAWKARGSLQGGSFSAWFLRIAHNEAINVLRRRERLQERLAEKTAEEMDTLAELLDDGLTPDEVAMDHETRKVFLAAVNMLPEPYRVAVILRYWEGLKYEEVASRLGVGLGAVKMRLSRAHGLLRKVLSQEGNSTRSLKN